MSCSVASFNLRFDNPDDIGNLWRERKEHVLKMLKHYGWDIVGMQEVRGNQMRDLAALDGYAVEGRSREPDPEGEHGPIFYNAAKFERLDGGTFWLSSTPDVPSKSWDSDCYRICTWLKLRDRQSGKTIAILNTHLDHVSEEARYQGARVILDWIDKHASDVPVILTGDFNASPEERCYRAITERLRDARRAAGQEHYGPWGTFTGFRFDVPTDELKEIDYIFVSPQVHVRKTRTVTDSFDRKYPSDHFPIEAMVEWQSSSNNHNHIQ